MYSMLSELTSFRKFSFSHNVKSFSSSDLLILIISCNIRNIHDADRNIIASDMCLKARLLSIHTSSDHLNNLEKMLHLTAGINQAVCNI
jgi:hypothetical protein